MDAAPVRSVPIYQKLTPSGMTELIDTAPFFLRDTRLPDPGIATNDPGPVIVTTPDGMFTSPREVIPDINFYAHTVYNSWFRVLRYSFPSANPIVVAPEDPFRLRIGFSFVAAVAPANPPVILIDGIGELSLPTNFIYWLTESDGGPLSAASFTALANPGTFTLSVFQVYRK